MDARQLIVQADEIRRDEGITQAEWCRRAGFDQFGKLISNSFNRGNCKLSVMIQLLKPLGYGLKIVKLEGKHDDERFSDRCDPGQPGSASAGKDGA